MGPSVTSLTLKGFRSLRDARVEFDNPTFLVGRNASGKSNIADAFSFLAEATASSLQEVFDRRGGIDNVLTKILDEGSASSLAISVELDTGEFIRTATNIQGDIASARYSFEVRSLPDYKFEIVREQCILNNFDGKKRWFDRNRDRVTTNVEPFSKQALNILEKGALALPLLSSFSAFEAVTQILRKMRVYSIEPSKLRDMQDPDSGTALRSDGANAASVFEDIERRSPDDVKRIGEFLAAIVPNTKTVEVIQHGKKLTLEFTQQWDGNKKLDFEAFNMSDGTLRAFGLLLAVFQRLRPSLIVVEEPEASMHPAGATAILDLLRLASRQMQVIVSTHSPEVLDAKWIQDRHLRIVNWHQGSTTITEVSDISRKALQDHLMQAGELLRSNALEPALPESVPSEANIFEEVN